MRKPVIRKGPPRVRSLKSAVRKERVFQLLVNRLAGNDPENSIKLAKKLGRQLKRAGREYHLAIAESWDQFGQMVNDAIRSRPFAVIVFGGDGSVRLVASRAVRSKTLLGIVPCGCFNSIFQSIYKTVDQERALDIVRSEYQRRIDIGLANGHFFLGYLVSGLVPKMVKRLGNKRIPRLVMGWTKLASHAAEDTVRRKTKIKVDSYTFEAEPYLLNIHLLSNLMTLRFASVAVPDDGRVVLIFDYESKRDVIAHYIRDIKKSRYQYTDSIRMIRGERIAISPIAGRTWLMDGDIVEFTGNDLAIEVLHRALRIFYHVIEKT